MQLLDESHGSYLDNDGITGYVFHLSSSEPEPELENKEDDSLAEKMSATNNNTMESIKVKKLNSFLSAQVLIPDM